MLTSKESRRYSKFYDNWSILADYRGWLCRSHLCEHLGVLWVDVSGFGPIVIAHSRRRNYSLMQAAIPYVLVDIGMVAACSSNGPRDARAASNMGYVELMKLAGITSLVWIIAMLARCPIEGCQLIVIYWSILFVSCATFRDHLKSRKYSIFWMYYSFWSCFNYLGAQYVGKSCRFAL